MGTMNDCGGGGWIVNPIPSVPSDYSGMVIVAPGSEAYGIPVYWAERQTPPEPMQFCWEITGDNPYNFVRMLYIELGGPYSGGLGYFRMGYVKVGADGELVGIVVTNVELYVGLDVCNGVGAVLQAG